ncbi:hypothetical protein Afil01_64670 [Actinorhabdospora filicis]|uniref:HTH luxR-type domain-containing protein n=1 Tax=Actinorhabdospora filicis TaxID=1785913 RepID=A0A9W6STH0_9ACTN|nr:hypothetical protein Afil01_64670 [Actinorhabdospora filicis]
METLAKRVYERMRAKGEGFGEAATALGVAPERVPGLRRHLSELGLLDPAAEIAVDALAALRRLTDEGDGQLAALAELMAARQRVTGALLRSFVDVASPGRAEIPAEAYGHDPRDRERLRAAVGELARGVRGEVLEMQPPAAWDPAVLESARSHDAAQLAAGARVRVLFVQSSLLDPHVREHLRLRAELGVEVRLTPVVATRMLVFDRRVAVLEGAGDDVRAVIVRGEHVAVPLAALHDHLWTGASSVTDVPRGAQDAQLSEQRRAVLRMLAEGAKDDTIARALGVSTRTVTRVVGELVATLEAGSRFQAGVRAARLGWLD